MRRKSPWRIIVTLILILAIIILGYGTYHFSSLLDEEQLKNQELQDEIDRNTQFGYVAIKDISMGEELIVDENVEFQQFYAGFESMLLWNPENGTTIATSDITATTPIFADMVEETMLDYSTREYEVSAVLPITNMEDYDVVDVRISFPDGSDYIVLSKKQVRDVNLKNCIFTMDLREDEILYLNSAILDAASTAGAGLNDDNLGGYAALLYVTRYRASELQEASVPTYPVKEATYNLLYSEKNATDVNVNQLLIKANNNLNKQARTMLEARLGEITVEEATKAQAAYNEIQQEFIRQINDAIEQQKNQ